jgi:DNA-directed RNA polymerase specialized sigma24 family protein
MADPHKPPTERAPAAPTRDADASDDDADAPVSSARPALRDAGASQGEARAPETRAEAPSTGVPLPELYAFLALESTQDRIRQVVRANVPPRTPRDVFDDIVQQANVNALGRKGRPTSAATLRPWISAVAKNAAIDHFRRATVQRSWEDRGVEVEEVPPEPADAPARPDDPEPEPWLISTWLEKRVAHHESDRRTYALLVQKAREDKTYEELAAERGETVAALKNRVHEFKKKYLPQRRRHEERRDAVLLVLRFGRDVLLLAAAAAAILLAFLYAMDLGPFAPKPRPAPSAQPARVGPPQGEDVGAPRPSAP